MRIKKMIVGLCLGAMLLVTNSCWLLEDLDESDGLIRYSSMKFVRGGHFYQYATTGTPNNFSH